ncbi:hypothetical protein [Nocardia harenae]|uniref:hypothetical protein n=1 Tax=Nocardia harenae TaxID=358707 RepID=UPI0008325186|nr:hypothetical protein [Nocardia harenae]
MSTTTTTAEELFGRARDLLSETFLVEYPDLLGFLGRRGVQPADAEDIVGNTYRSMLERLADTAAELATLPDGGPRARELLTRLTARPGRGLLFTAVRNRHLSECRSPGPVPVAEPVPAAAPDEYVPVLSGAGSVAEPVGMRHPRQAYEAFDIDPAVVVLAECTSARRHAALRRLVRVLVERGGLTAGAIELIDRIYAFTETGAEEPAPGSDRRERGARKRNGHAHDPNRGRIAATARELGRSVTTVSRGNAALLAVLRRALYVAGVLAAAGTMRRAADIGAALDGYDRFRTGTERQVLALLDTGAAAVGTDPATGTRASRDRVLGLLAAQAVGEPAAHLDRLHAAEAALAALLGNPHPNCVTVCPPHNPDPTRTWEH